MFTYVHVGDAAAAIVRWGRDGVILAQLLHLFRREGIILAQPRHLFRPCSADGSAGHWILLKLVAATSICCNLVDVDPPESLGPDICHLVEMHPLSPLGPGIPPPSVPA